MKLEIIDDQGCSVLAEPRGTERLHLTTDLMGGDGATLTIDQVEQLVAFLGSWLARLRGMVDERPTQ